jgi:DNA-directed RNA polymerase specialized sigma24 family protein
MSIHDLLSPSDYSEGSNADEVLERYDTYIVNLARKKMPHNIASPETLHLEIDELTQNSRIKLWLALKKRQITNPKAYIACIVHTESVDLTRKYKSVQPLLLNEDGEPFQENLIAKESERLQDPQEVLERNEMIADYMAWIVNEVLALPPCQQRAMICSLKDRLDDTLPLRNAFRSFGVDIESVNWPEEKSEIHKIKASLSAARRKLLLSKGKMKRLVDWN